MFTYYFLPQKTNIILDIQVMSYLSVLVSIIQTIKGFTGKIGDWKLMYEEIFADKNLAMKRELKIKSWKSRIMIRRIN